MQRHSLPVATTVQDEHDAVHNYVNYSIPIPESSPLSLVNTAHFSFFAA